MRRSADRPLGVSPATVGDYRELARRRLPRQLFDYLDGGAYEEATMRANVADLERDPPAPARDARRVRARAGRRRARPAAVHPDRAGAGRARRDVRPARRGPGGPRGRARRDRLHRVDRLDLPDRGGRRRHRSAALVPAVRDARPRLRRGPDGPRAGRRLAGAGADVDLAVVGARHRDIRNGMAARAPAGASCAAASTSSATPRWVREVAARRQAADLRQPREGRPGRAHPERLPRLGGFPVRPIA